MAPSRSSSTTSGSDAPGSSRLGPGGGCVTAGIGVFDPLGNEGDVLGLAFAWLNPDDAAARDQLVIETFYRIQITPAIQLTPDLQIIIDPSFNAEDDVIAVFGLRFRIQY